MTRAFSLLLLTALGACDRAVAPRPWMCTDVRTDSAVVGADTLTITYRKCTR